MGFGSYMIIEKLGFDVVRFTLPCVEMPVATGSHVWSPGAKRVTTTVGNGN